MRTRTTLVALTLSLVLVGLAGRVEALRVARPYALSLLAPHGPPRASDDPITGLPPAPSILTLASDGALVVSPQPATGRGGNRDPNAVRVMDASGAAIRTRVETIAPDLHRIVPTRRLASGTLRVTGIPGVRSLRVARGTPRVATAPSIDRVTNHRTPLDPAQPAGAMNERVVVSLREPPPAGAALLVARWVDWHDAEGGLYGAWAPVAAGTTGELVLICSAGPPCGARNGHIPRANERGELRWVDTNGRLSDATTITVTSNP